MGSYLKGSFEILAIILALVVSYYELKEVIPSDPIIILEVDKLKTPHDTPEYLLTGVVADQDYILDWIRVIPYSDKLVKQATFKYDHYTTDVNLTEITSTTPHEYLVSKEMLQTKFGDDNFVFAFLDDNRFTFYFQFEGVESEKATFECKALAENHSVPCEVRGKGYLSLFRGIPWYFLAAFFGILVIVIIELIDIFVKRGGRKNVRRGKKTRNRLIPEQD